MSRWIMIVVSLLTILLGAFCASDLWWETFGRGNAGGYVVIAIGVYTLGTSIKDWYNEKTRFTRLASN